MLAIQDAKDRMSLEGILGAGADILGAIGSTNEKALKISQGFAAAEALVSTYRGPAKEREKGVMGFSTAAAVIAKGAAFIAAIQGAKSGSVGAAGSATAAAPLPIQRVDIAIAGGSSDVTGTVQAVIDQLNEAAARGYRVDARLVGR